MLTFEKAIEAFRYNMETFETPKKTVEVRLMAVNMFKNYCWNSSGIELVDDVDYEIAITFINFLKNEGSKSGSTINSYIMHIRSFFKMLHQTKLIKEDKVGFFRPFPKRIAENIKSNRQKEYKNKDIKRFISKEDREKILAATSKTYDPRRNALMLELTWVCALRISETVELKVSDIDFNKHTILIRNSKRHKTRTFICGNVDFMRRLSKYIDDMFLTEDEYVFKNRSRRAQTANISPDGADGIFRETLGYAGLPVGRKEGGYCTHDMRGTGITIMLESGVPLVVVRDLVGHNDIQQTMTYYRSNDSDAKYQMLKNAAKKGADL